MKPEVNHVMRFAVELSASLEAKGKFAHWQDLLPILIKFVDPYAEEIRRLERLAAEAEGGRTVKEIAALMHLCSYDVTAESLAQKVLSLQSDLFWQKKKVAELKEIIQGLDV